MKLIRKEYLIQSSGKECYQIIKMVYLFPFLFNGGICWTYEVVEGSECLDADEAIERLQIILNK